MTLRKTAWSFADALASLRQWFRPKAAVPEEYEKKAPTLIRARKFDRGHTQIFNKAMKANFAGTLAKTEFKYTKPDGTIAQKTIIPYTSKKSKDGNYVVVGYDPAKAALRSYRMDRIENVKTAFIRGFEKQALEVKTYLNAAKKRGEQAAEAQKAYESLARRHPAKAADMYRMWKLLSDRKASLMTWAKAQKTLKKMPKSVLRIAMKGSGL